MKPVQLTVNGRAVGESVEPRMHLADFLRERLNLTATHLRCEQGACGACTLLIDGQPSRPFSFETLPPRGANDSSRLQIIRRTSRHRHARPLPVVYEEIERRLTGAA